jgi:hypothetical protein
MELSVRSVRGAGPIRIPFSVVDYRDEPLDFQQVSTSNRILSVQIKQKPSSYLPGWKYDLELTVADTQQSLGNSSESVILQTNDPEHKQLRILVAIERVSRIRVSPTVLSLKPDPKTGIQVGNVFIDDRDGQAVEIDSIGSPSPALECKLNPSFPGGKVYQVTLDQSKLSNGEKALLEIKVRFKKPTREETCINVVPKS